MGIVALQDSHASAGIIVWWELSGCVDVDDLADAWSADLAARAPSASEEDVDLPEAPTLTTALQRAAYACLPDRRHLVRPLARRGAWEVVRESVVREPDGREHLEYARVAAGWVEGGAVQLDGDSAFCEAVRAAVSHHGMWLTASDVSSWLLAQASTLDAVGLRSRGGFYFIPRDRVDAWERFARVLRTCSAHRLYQMPAMRSEEAVEAILSSLRGEALASLKATEDWLRAGTCSTRGLNATEAQLARLRAKLAHYCELLHVQVPDLDQRLTEVSGLLVTTRLIDAAAEE